MGLDEALLILRRRWLPVLLLAAAGVLTAFLTYSEAPREVRYRATSTVEIQRAAPGDPTQTPRADIVALVIETEIAARVGASLGESDHERLSKRVSAKPIEAQTIDITFTGTEPGRTALVANTFATEVAAEFEARRTKDLTAAIKDANDRVARLTEELNGLALDSPARAPVSQQLSLANGELARLAGAQGPRFTHLRVVRQALPVRASSGGASPPAAIATRTAILGVLGLVLGSGLVLAMERAWPRVRSVRQAETAFGLPVVASVPRMAASAAKGRRVIAHEEPLSATAEAYRNLRSAAMLMPLSVEAKQKGLTRDDASRRVFLVTSPSPAEGKTTTIANLAASFAEICRSVLVIGADLRRPAIGEMLGVEGGPGLTDLTEDAQWSEVKQAIRRTNIKHVWLLPGGSPVDNPAAAISQRRLLVSGCRELVEVVLIDSPPILVANDVRELTTVVDGVIVVSRIDRTLAADAEAAASLLRRLDAPVVGVVLNGVERSGRGYGQYYGYYRVSATGASETNGSTGDELGLAGNPGLGLSGRGVNGRRADGRVPPAPRRARQRRSL